MAQQSLINIVDTVVRSPSGPLSNAIYIIASEEASGNIPAADSAVKAVADYLASGGDLKGIARIVRATLDPVQSSHLSSGSDDGGSRSDKTGNATSSKSLAKVLPGGNNLRPPQCDPNAYRGEPNACDNTQQHPCEPLVQNDIITPGIHLI